MRSILHMYCQQCTSKGSPSKKPQNWKFNERQRTEWKECRKDMRRKQWRERKENKEGEKKNGGPRGCPPVRCRHKFSKRKKKNKRMKRTKKKQRSMFSMHLDFYKISLGHFQTRSKSLSRALLQFEHTNAQHTGIWWLPRPTFCQAAPFVIIPHWRCYCSHSLEWSCDRLEISVHTNCQSSHLYFSHFVSHSLEWSFDISDELEHLKPSFEIIQLWWRYCSLIRSVHLKHSTHTKCQQVALSHIPSTGRTQFTFWLPRRTWNFNLK